MNLAACSLLFLVIFITPLSAQTERQIAAIRADVSLINKSAAKYEKKTKLVEGISLEGAEATYFTSGRGLKKITAKMFGETFRATAEFYFSGEEMIFAYQRLQRYDTHIAMTPPPKVIKIIEIRVYYSGAKPIRVMLGKKQIAESDVAFDESAREMSELSDTLKAAFNR